MKRKEAIKELRKFEKGHFEKSNGDTDVKVYEALSMAIEALENAAEYKKVVLINNKGEEWEVLMDMSRYLAYPNWCTLEFLHNMGWIVEREED